MGPVRAELTVRRSRFIGELNLAATRVVAERRIALIREDHPRASHVVYAFITGTNRSEISGMSDDGEPRGTAGRPVMDVLKGSGLINTLITVVRYFGGTRLGTGGLVRAYGEIARKVADGAERVPFRVLETYAVSVPYDLHLSVRTVLSGFGAEVVGEEFTHHVTIVFTIESELVSGANEALQNVSRGTCLMHPVDESGETTGRTESET